MSNKETVNNSATTYSVHPVVAQDVNFDMSSFKRATLASFAIATRRLLKNWQQGTVASQGRSDVSRTNRKPWKQKGTGRARAGTARSPLWKGGGVIFGPQQRVRTLKMSKNSRKKVILTLFAKFLEEKKVVYVDWSMDNEQPKTAAAYTLLESTGLVNRKIVLFVAPYDFQLALSFANISNVHPLSFDQSNVFDLANSDCWLFFKKDFDHFKGMVSQWL